MVIDDLQTVELAVRMRQQNHMSSKSAFEIRETSLLGMVGCWEFPQGKFILREAQALVESHCYLSKVSFSTVE